MPYIVVEGDLNAQPDSPKNHFVTSVSGLKGKIMIITKILLIIKFLNWQPPRFLSWSTFLLAQVETTTLWIFVSTHVLS